MKPFLILLFSGMSLFSNAQGGMSVEDPRQTIWRTAVQAIIDFDEDKIIELTHFPLKGDWHSFGNLSAEEEKKLFAGSLNFFFPEEMREMLKEKDFNSLVVYPYQGSMAFAITYFNEEMESTTVIDFWDIQGVWKITSLTIK